MTLNLDIQKATAADLETIIGLLQDAALWLKGKNIQQWLRWQAPDKEMVDWARAGVKAGEFFIAGNSGDTAGIFRLTLDNDRLWTDNKPAVYLHAFTTARNYSGSGTGTAMLEWMKAYCRENKRPLLRLDCHAWSVPLRSYYEEHGFKYVADKESIYGMVSLYEMAL